MKKLTPKRVRKIVTLLVISSILLVLVGLFAQIPLLEKAGIFILLSGAVFHLVFYKCPHCGAFLDRITCDYCPRCGQKFDN